MIYEVQIEGLQPGMLHHNIDGGFVSSPAKDELERLTSLTPKAKKEVANVARMRELEWRLSLYATGTGDDALPTLPPKVIRSCIHAAAKLTKDGQRVNRGLQIVAPVEFTYGEDTGKTVGELAAIPAYRHEAVAAVQRQRVLRVRAIFPVWAASFRMNVDPEMASPDSIKDWLVSAGTYIGVGDWRPDRGGEYGMFKLTGFEEVEVAAAA